jgi:dihydrofolate synthase / folylpolyglutamate synthase
MDYIQSLRYLYSLADFERSGRFSERADVEPVKALLHELGDPHLGRATVHIAGSKGKGSVAAMVESMVRAAGYRTGLFTSPHLHRFTERIQVGGGWLDEQSEEGSRAVGQSDKEHELKLRPVPTAEFAEGMTEVAAAIERVMAAMPERRLLTFDALTALGFLLFRKHGVEVQVIEVGLGGLLDSTNVFQTSPPNPLSLRGEGGPDTPSPLKEERGLGGEVPLVTVITNIGLEHREILGDTVPEIARQKAGIIQPGVPVIMAPQRESAADVIREVAAAKGAPLTEVALSCNLRRDQAGSDLQTFRLRTSKAGYNVKLPVIGKHQLDNAATAVLAVEALDTHLSAHPEALEGPEALEEPEALEGSPSPQAGRGPGGGVTPEAVQKGLESVRWPGRIEILKRRPYLIVDSAHTADSARRLRDTLNEYLRLDNATLVVGVMGDKDLEGLMMAVEPVARRVIATQADHPRALPAEQVARVFRDRSIETYVEPKLGAAIDMAMSLSTGFEAVVILGSVALAGEARAHVLGLERDPPV